MRPHPAGKPKLGTPKNCTKIFYTKRIDDSELDSFIEFALLYSVNVRRFGIQVPNPDSFLLRAIEAMKEKEYLPGKINYIIRRKMTHIKLGVESGRIIRAIKP